MNGCNSPWAWPQKSLTSMVASVVELREDNVLVLPSQAVLGFETRGSSSLAFKLLSQVMLGKNHCS